MNDDLQAAVANAGAKLRFTYPWWLRPFLQRGVVAITLGRRIYVGANTAQEQIEKLLRHEIVHVQQVARLGIIRFYWQYAREYVGLRRQGFNAAEAYRRISFEVEAFAAEKTL